MKKNVFARIFGDAFLAVVLCVLYMPIVLIIVFSFSGNSMFVFSDGFTLSSYAEIFTSPKTALLLEALKTTLIIATVSSIVSTILGTVSAVGIHYLSPRIKKLTLAVNQLPMINSEIVLAVSLMIFFATVNFIPAGYAQLIISHIAFCTPYVILSIMPKLAQMDPNMYEAALDLGATPFKAMTKVVFPYIMPGIISGFVMAFTISMDDFVITQMNKGDSGLNTLSTYIYSDARVGGLEPFWFAVFSIFFVVVLTVLLFSNLKKSTNGEGNK